MTIYLIGNILVDEDAVPLKLKKALQGAFPKLSIIEIDPTEEFVPEAHSLIIDTVQGIDQVKLFRSLDQFLDHPLISVHDYDLLLHLQLLKKRRAIDDVCILGIPMGSSLKSVKDEVVEEVRTFISTSL